MAADHYSPFSGSSKNCKIRQVSVPGTENPHFISYRSLPCPTLSVREFINKDTDLQIKFYFHIPEMVLRWQKYNFCKHLWVQIGLLFKNLTQYDRLYCCTVIE